MRCRSVSWGVERGATNLPGLDGRRAAHRAGSRPRAGEGGPPRCRSGGCAADISALAGVHTPSGRSGVRGGSQPHYRVPERGRATRPLSRADDGAGATRRGRAPADRSRILAPGRARCDRRLPIVVVAVDYDPIVRGYVGSLARPGGNITGTFLRQPELTPKWIELLREVLPGIKRVALFWDAFSADQADEADTAANNAGLQFLRTEFRQPPTPSTPRCARRRGSRPAPCSDSRPRSSTASAPIWPRPRSAAGCRPWCRSRSRPRQAF